jgi:hypothetical protein|tara:strand:- start:385 stop:555 length:171 start_codon:yes stop_codon:yes gene_type:complete
MPNLTDKERKIIDECFLTLHSDRNAKNLLHNLSYAVGEDVAQKEIDNLWIKLLQRN